jgi:hypothetical protein
MAQTIVEKIAQAHLAEGPKRLCVPVISFPSVLFM